MTLAKCGNCTRLKDGVCLVHDKIRNNTDTCIMSTDYYHTNAKKYKVNDMGFNPNKELVSELSKDSPDTARFY